MWLLNVNLTDQPLMRASAAGKQRSGALVDALFMKVESCRTVWRKSTALQLAGSLVVGGSVGWLAWGAGPGLASLLWILVLPAMWGLSASRWAMFTMVLGYYLAAARGLPGGAAVFFSESGEFAGVGWVVWVGVSVLLALPYGLLWSSSLGRSRGWRFLGAVGAACVPPLALIGGIGPLAVAGVLYPGLGVVGVALCLALLMVLVMWHWRSVVALLLLGVLANGVVWSSGEASVPSAWQGVDTHVRLLSGREDQAGLVLAAMQRVKWMTAFEKTVPANSVWVLPETMMGSFGAVSELSLRETEQALALRGSRVLVGAELEQADGRYVNGLVVLGALEGEDRFVVQNIPLPYAMWKPWSSKGAVADVFGTDNVISVGGLRVGALICYEQFLSFSLLRMMLSKPDVVVAASNVWWVAGPTLPAIQTQLVSAYARLFGVGVLFSRNL